MPPIHHRGQRNIVTTGKILGKLGGKIAAGGKERVITGTYGANSKLGKRHGKSVKETIMGITKPAIRRMARRGGVKRLSALIYDESRHVLK